MPSRAELEQQSQFIETIVAMAWQQLQSSWADLSVKATPASVTDPAVLDAVTDLLAGLVDAWGDVAATSAADFYDEMRARAGATGTFSAVLASSPSRNQVAGSVRWALDPWAQAVIVGGGGFDPRTGEPLPGERQLPDEVDLERMLGKLQGPLQRLIRQTGRNTIDQSVARDPARPRVARVPMGEETCAFCLVLASRGPVYRSTTTAGHDTKFHDFDDCEQVVVWQNEDELPEGYDEGELYAKYVSAGKAAGSSDLRKILRELRQQEGIR